MGQVSTSYNALFKNLTSQQRSVYDQRLAEANAEPDYTAATRHFLAMKAATSPSAVRDAAEADRQATIAANNAKHGANRTKLLGLTAAAIAAPFALSAAGVGGAAGAGGMTGMSAGSSAVGAGSSTLGNLGTMLASNFSAGDALIGAGMGGIGGYAKTGTLSGTLKGAAIGGVTGGYSSAVGNSIMGSLPGSTGIAPSSQILWDTPGQAINWAPMGQSIAGSGASGLAGLVSNAGSGISDLVGGKGMFNTASKVLQAASLFGAGGQPAALASQKIGNPAPSAGEVPQFIPQRPSPLARPASLNEMAGMDATQERSALATRGKNVGLGGDEQSYYRNLIQRSLIGDGGQVDVNNPNQLLPIESSYLSKQGYDTSSLMKMLQQFQG